MHVARRTFVTLAVTMLVTMVCLPAPAAAQEDRWATAMSRFEQEDRTNPPPQGGIVFVGSSSIVRWDLQKHFPRLPVINRGFGGSHVADSVRHVELLVIKHRPRTVVFYAGDNDIAAGKTPQQVADDFRAFAQKVHSALPETRIAFIAIKPSTLRWEMVDKMRQANALIGDYCRTSDRLGYVDVDGPMLGWDDKPRAELLVADGLHLTEQGYDLWSFLIRPFLDQP